MDYGVLSLVPPLLAIAVAAWTRRIMLALIVGIFSGELLLCGGDPFGAVSGSLKLFLAKLGDADNLMIFIFTALMGAFVLLARVSGGVEGFVNYMVERSRKVRSGKAAMLIAYVIGIIVFVDGLLSIMFTGIVSRPLTDRFKVSREKLAYICDSTSAPINALIPLNSWGAMLMGLIGAEIASGVIRGDAGSLLMASLPFQFYSIFSVLFVLYYIVTGKDWGPMKKAELRVRETGRLIDEGCTPLLQDDDGEVCLAAPGTENRWNMILPLILLIGGTFVGLLVTGGGNIAKGDGTSSILYSMGGTLIVMCVMFARQGLMDSRKFSDYVMKGVANMLSLVLLLVLAFVIGGVIKKLGTGAYLASLAAGRVSGAYGPAIIFVLGAFMAFCTGTSWGTFAIMMPIGIPMAASMGSNILLAIGAVVSGGIFGDHCSPMSDTTILSAMSAGTDLYSHTKTQLPYALLSALCATAAFVVCGLVM